jgi:hypothetical protein
MHIRPKTRPRPIMECRRTNRRVQFRQERTSNRRHAQCLYMSIQIRPKDIERHEQNRGA